MKILPPPPPSFTPILAFSPLLYTIYLEYVQQTAFGVPAMLPAHISLCVSAPFQLLNQMTDFYGNRYTSYATKSLSNITLSIYCNF